MMNAPDAGSAQGHTPATWKQWGHDLDPASIEQMRAACSLPVSVAGALMPDAHTGYGLPIGGVLATVGAVIPYAVGVDIACRMRLTVIDQPASALSGQRDRLAKAIEEQTRFGIGAEFRDRRNHDVMDLDWSVSPVTKRFRDRAWAQLGTSGSGNHFVEFGELHVTDPSLGIPTGDYIALLSHSGSRGPGAQVCQHYSRLATDKHTGLSGPQKQLAWLDLDSAEGLEYWAAMELMGHFAAANHELIHRHIVKAINAKTLLSVENHHNFAWKETHRIDGILRDVVVHRKGATPAGLGTLGIIPGSMATPGFVVRGRGNPDSLCSASHGAGRLMSRTQARNTFTWSATRKLLAERGVHLLSADIDEVPGVYKDIHQVMEAQHDLVEVLASFQPRIVKMAPPGEKAED